MVIKTKLRKKIDWGFWILDTESYYSEYLIIPMTLTIFYKNIVLMVH